MYIVIWFLFDFPALMSTDLIATQQRPRRNGATIGEVGEETILNAIRRCG